MSVGWDDDAAAVRAPEWLLRGDGPISHSLVTIITRIDASAREIIAAQILEQVRFHSAYRRPPAGYQFLLPNGAYLTAYDQVVGRRRRLGFWSARGPAKRFLVVAARAWPRGVPDTGAWFSWPLSDRKVARLLGEIGHAVDVAYENRDDVRRDRTIVIDPGLRPERVES